ncbi:MAG: signal peptidase I [Thermoguttaceae bacterium]|jgi:signal peptidase I
MSKRKSSDPKVGDVEPGSRKIPRSGHSYVTSEGKSSLLSSWIPSPDALRETVESIIVAFVLAFLFRTFEAEAFVIPTGSMAPTLMGRHKDLCCPECGYQFQLSASDTRQGDGDEQEAIVRGGTCPICRHPVNLFGGDFPTYNGDRILVAKFPYAFEQPQRWDVIVFRFPGHAVPNDISQNYIKRLVGLPGETVEIHHGNLWIWDRIRDPNGTFEIARKPPKKLLAMLQPVFDNDLAPKVTALGWPARWQAVPAGDRTGQWVSNDGQSFSTDGSAPGEAWLRYSHLAPSYWQWQEMVRRHALPAGETVRPQLISDFTAYDTVPSPLRQEPGPSASSVGLHWVGDLAVECTLELQSDSGEVVFELIKGGHRFRCTIDAASGTATLAIPGAAAAPRAETAVRGPGRHKIMFSNVADELRLWVDGGVMTFDAPTTYDSFALGARIPTRLDLHPAGIAARQAAATISHLRLSRDIYYIAAEESIMMDFKDGRPPDLGDSRDWATAFDNDNMRRIEFPLADPDTDHPGKDRFFVLGDNSASSKDGRLWGTKDTEYWVSRDLLIGKAMFIYWPHSWGQLPGPLAPLPCFPNFKRMRLVR